MPGTDTVNEYISAYADHSYRVLRIGLGLVVFLAGLHKVFSPAVWASYIAPWAASILGTLGISGILFMQVNAVAEMVFGLAIL
ncbi:MAG: hypothetical protein ABEK00_03735, partial [Candidatus Nanohaloarchaea archaeon]